MRGKEESQKIIGHKIIGEYHDEKFAWILGGLDRREDIETLVKDLGLKNFVIYPIYESGGTKPKDKIDPV